jgi:potassium-transporting ATPase KdpC subunit
MKTLYISLKIFLFFTVLTGIFYPLFVTGIAQLTFPFQANGSLIVKNTKIIGSELIGQRFDSIIYFTSRPSAILNNPLPSGGSNFGLTNSKLKHSVDSLKREFILFNHLDTHAEIPSEMLFSSASGLDPHISPEAAYLQVERIAKARNLSDSQKMSLEKWISSSVNYPQFGILGEDCVNVLLLNLELDQKFIQNSHVN